MWPYLVPIAKMSARSFDVRNEQTKPLLLNVFSISIPISLLF
jgi:hypothetical protein